VAGSYDRVSDLSYARGLFRAVAEQTETARALPEMQTDGHGLDLPPLWCLAGHQPNFRGIEARAKYPRLITSYRRSREFPRPARSISSPNI